MKRRERERRSNDALRLLPVVAPVVVGAFAALAAAGSEIAQSGHAVTLWLELATLLAAAIFVEAFPVPLRGVSAGGVSLAAVFIVATGSLYGWTFAAVLAFATRGAIELAERRPPIRFAYNSAVYGLSGAAAGLSSGVWSGDDGVGRLLVRVLLGSTAFYLTNLVLVVAIIARASGERPDRVLSETGRWTLVPFAIMSSVTLILDALWQRSPLLAAALVGPLVAISLYQRSVHKALEAMELALTDPLSGLGNHRRFRQQLERGLDDAEQTSTCLTLCLLDIDDFKEVNDRHGHPLGDRVLQIVGDSLRHDGEGFRLGGDEFALLLPECDSAAAFAIARRIVSRISGSEVEPGVTVSVSAGVATYPGPGVGRNELVRLADRTLYAAKAEGKNTVRLYQPGVVELSTRRALEESDRRARLRAAACLAGAIDVRDASTGSHSHAVGELAARIASRLGLNEDEVELARLAGQLHDLGKLAIGEEILQKAGPLLDDERQVVRSHPHVGYRMLSSLGIEPVATWVLHHHERWDGCGYPNGLAGEEIPTGSRILFVADAYEAMTADRVYRGRMSDAQAIAELERCAGSQFDPRVVAALVEELAPPVAAGL